MPIRISSRTTSQRRGRNGRAGPVTFPRSVEGACSAGSFRLHAVTLPPPGTLVASPLGRSLAVSVRRDRLSINWRRQPEVVEGRPCQERRHRAERDFRRHVLWCSMGGKRRAEGRCGEMWVTGCLCGTPGRSRNRREKPQARVWPRQTRFGSTGAGCRPSTHRRARLSLGLVASPQSQPPFHRATTTILILRTAAQDRHVPCSQFLARDDSR